MNQLTIARSRKHDPRDGWYTFTPPQAAQLLQVGRKNRPLNETRAKEIAADIMDGHWKPNGETFIFDEQNLPIDCQHRLRACVIANRPIEGYCVFGIPSEYFATLDQGSKRSGSDLSALAGFPRAALTASLVRLVTGYYEGTLANNLYKKISSEKLHACLKDHRAGLIRAATLVAPQSKGLARIVPLSHAAFLAFTVDSPRMAEFIQKLSSGEGLYAGDPLMVFRSRMTALIGEKHRLTMVHKLALLIKTWNAHIAGRKMASFVKWNKDIEAFPTVVVP